MNSPENSAGLSHEERRLEEQRELLGELQAEQTRALKNSGTWYKAREVLREREADPRFLEPEAHVCLARNGGQGDNAQDPLIRFSVLGEDRRAISTHVAISEEPFSKYDRAVADAQLQVVAEAVGRGDLPDLQSDQATILSPAEQAEAFM